MWQIRVIIINEYELSRISGKICQFFRDYNDDKQYNLRIRSTLNWQSAIDDYYFCQLKNTCLKKKFYFRVLKHVLCFSLISGQTESVTSSQGQDRTHQLSILIICKIASLINPIPRVVYNFNEWKCWSSTKEVTRLIKSDLIRSYSNQLRKLFGTRRRTRDTADIIIIDLDSWELPKDRPCIKWQIKVSSPFNYVKMALENSKQKQFSIREFVDLRWSWTEKYIYQINIRMHDPPTTTSMAEREEEFLLESLMMARRVNNMWRLRIYCANSLKCFRIISMGQLAVHWGPELEEREVAAVYTGQVELSPPKYSC